MRTSRTQWVILGILTDGPMTGYEIRQRIDESIGFFWRESFGQIYPVLARLTRRGLIRRTTGRAEGPRQRRAYAITDAGRSVLATWLQQPPEDERVRNELLLKTFFSHATSLPVIRTHVEHYLHRQRELAAYFASGSQEVEAVNPPRKRLAWRLTLRAGQLVVEARIRWAEEALAALQAGRSPGGSL